MGRDWRDDLEGASEKIDRKKSGAGELVPAECVLLSFSTTAERLASPPASDEK